MVIPDIGYEWTGWVQEKIDAWCLVWTGELSHAYHATTLNCICDTVESEDVKEKVDDWVDLGTSCGRATDR